MMDKPAQGGFEQADVVFGCYWLQNVEGLEVGVTEIAFAVGGAAVGTAEAALCGGVFAAVFTGEETAGFAGG